MTDLFEEPEGATNISPEERDGLLQTWIANRAGLNKAEAQNILDGTAWARRRRGTNAADLLVAADNHDIGPLLAFARS
jgi:fido (protein-threonine AMPylation protein)